MKDKKIDEKVLLDIFDTVVYHCEWLEKECHHRMFIPEFNRYLIGARYALDIALDLDSDSRILIDEFFDQKLDEYFGGKERE